MISILLGLFGGKGKLIACIGGVVVVALLLVGMLVRIAFLKADITTLKGEKVALNATIVTEQGLRANAETRANLAEADENRLHRVNAGLNNLLEDERTNNREYVVRLATSQEISRKAVAVKPEQTTGVIDDATSNSAVGLLNSVFLQQ